MPPTVDCGMVDFSYRDRRSNSVLPLRFGQGIKPPRWLNFAQNMHPIKQCRRSIAHQNRTTPEYHNVDNDVAVGRPWRLCVIAPIAFVGGRVDGAVVHHNLMVWWIAGVLYSCGREIIFWNNVTTTNRQIFGFYFWYWILNMYMCLNPPSYFRY